jgi:hypothetical protein
MLILLSPPVITVAHLTTPAINAHFRKAIKEGCGGGRGGGCGSGHGGQKRGWAGYCPNSWDKWGANGETLHPGANKASADGVKQRNGLWMMNCKSCGWDKIHTPG